jgi:transcriptional regulator with XRE-family HTH domain
MENQLIALKNIKYLAAKRRLSISELAGKIDMTYVGLSKIIRENTTTLPTLLKIANVLNVPIQFFFIEEEKVRQMWDFSMEKFFLLQAENEELKKEITELKNKIIRLADRL